MKKENIALIIFLLFIVGAGVYYSSVQTVPKNIVDINNPVVHREIPKVVAPTLPDMTPLIPQAKVSTEGWKTCRNEEYGYEFKYPGEWYRYVREVVQHVKFTQVSVDCNGANVTLSTTPIHELNVYEDTPGTRIYNFFIFKNTDLKNMDEWIANQKNPGNVANLRMVPKYRRILTILQTYLIDGQKMVLNRSSYIQTGAVVPNSETIIFFNKENTWGMNIGSYPPNLPLWNDTLETILSTFKFIK